MNNNFVKQFILMLKLKFVKALFYAEVTVASPSRSLFS